MDKPAPDIDGSLDGRWLSYAELAELRGIGHQSARRLTHRLRWRRQKDNRGAIRIFVPADYLRPEHRLVVDKPADMPADLSALTVSWESVISTLREQLAAAEARAGRAEQDLAGERARGELQRDRIEALQDELRILRESYAVSQHAELTRLARTRLERLWAAWRGD